MFGLMLTLFLQAAGPDAPAQVVVPTETTAPAQTTEAAAGTDTESSAERPRRRCTQRAVTGSRLSNVIRCRSRESYQDQDTRDTLHNLQRPEPAVAG